MDQEIFQICQRCAGTGDYKHKTCPDCDGSGRLLFGYLVTKDDSKLKKESEKKEAKKAY